MSSDMVPVFYERSRVNEVNNATYVFNGDWKSASQLTKTEVLSGHVQEARIYHTEKWYERTGKLISRAGKRVA